ARKYCNNEAQERLANISPLLSDKTYATSAHSTQYSGTSNEKAQFKLIGPYFPILPIPSGTSTPSDSLPQESISYTIHDAPSTLALANMFRNARGEEKKSIDKMTDLIIQQFDENSSSKESIQELAVLAAIPDQRIFIAIISQFLKVEKGSPAFPELTVYGLAVILTSAPEEIDLKERQGLLSDIIERLQFRLEKTRIENNSEELLPLLRTLSALFDAMLCRKMKHLCRQDVYNPIKDRLSELASYDGVDPEVSFLAQYAIQSLAYIGNDESLSMSIFRRGRLAIGIIVDIKSAVLNFDIGVFESVYDKIISMSDSTIKMEWYQGLLFLDCLLANEDLSSFEKFITQSNLNSNAYFMQGVCLRLEQVLSLYKNHHISLGTQKLLRDLESYPTKSVQVTAQMALNQLSTTCCTPGTTGTRLTPLWDNSWYSDPNSHLLKVAQDSQKRDLNMLTAGSTLQNIHDDLKKIASTTCSIVEVNNALMDHYSSQLTIQRVSGKPLYLESCYINLAIVEASCQRKQDEEELKKQQEKFIRMPSYEGVSSNTGKLIPLEEILDKRKLLNGNEGVPKRILIIGRAGVGKTTFCKKLIHMFQKGQWKDRFDTALWLPLRLLKGYRSRKLEDLLLEKYLFGGIENERKGLAQEFIRSAEKGRVLFILDGLDEFVTDTDTEEGDLLQTFVKTLLKQHNVIVTTRPYGNDRSLLHDLDLELETVGFSSDNVE
ncbi:hypothetical protein BGZ76_005631, partial [Entomortierella beljakovae]